MYIAVYLRYHVSLLVNINIFYMTPQRATWKNSYYMLNVLPSLNKVLLLLLLFSSSSPSHGGEAVIRTRWECW